jgi:hypothetical protein
MSVPSGLLDLILTLRRAGYDFVTPTPLTHQRVVARSRCADDIRGVFGWNLPFAESCLPPDLFRRLVNDSIIQPDPLGWKSVVRAATLFGDVYLHSQFPTVEPNAVFFGPDTYRFARAVRDFLRVRRDPVSRAVDIGAGAGAGAMVIARSVPSAEVVMADINSTALEFSRVNATGAGLPNVIPMESDIFQNVPGTFDLIVTNPPYLNDVLGRTYRHGGGTLGSALSYRIALSAVEMLRPGGTLLMYTGAPIVGGHDQLLQNIRDGFFDPEIDWTYEELDPDVFGEELQTDAYKVAERIAVVLFLATRKL